MIFDQFNEVQNENAGNIRSTLSNIYLKISEELVLNNDMLVTFWLEPF